jgi:hypothetical protein
MMKTKLLIIAGLLAIACMMMIAPVIADTTGTTSVTGNVGSTASIQLNDSSVVALASPGQSAGVLTPGTTASNQSLGITVTSNSPFSVTVADNTPRDSGDQGYLGNYTTSYQTSPLNTKLTHALSLNGGFSSGSITGFTIGSDLTPITSTPLTLYSSSGPVTGQILAPNTFSQQISNTDTYLPSGSVYKIDLLFTIGQY